jgi:hypothetical protein
MIGERILYVFLHGKRNILAGEVPDITMKREVQ